MSKCPTCGSALTSQLRQTMNQNDQLYRRSRRQFQRSIEDYVRQSRVAKLDSCILCVQKHVSRAMIYHEQFMMAQNSGTSDGTARVNKVVNHLKILGHLGCAIQQSQQFTELNEQLIINERNYRYNMISPDWNTIIQLITKILQEEEQKKS